MPAASASPPVNVRLRQSIARLQIRNRRLEDAQQNPDDEQAQRCPAEREHHALGHQLPDEPAARSAERETHRHLAPPGDRQARLQRADRRAGDRQHEDRDQQRDQLADQLPPSILYFARRRKVVVGEQRDDVGGENACLSRVACWASVRAAIASTIGSV